MSRLSPGERAHNWAQALVTLWPVILALLGGAVYGNSEAVRNFIHGEPIPTADDVDKIIEGGFEAQVKHSIDTIINKLDEIEKKQNRIVSQSHDGDHQLSDRLTKIEQLVN